jgi:hypothetical protein
MNIWVSSIALASLMTVCSVPHVSALAQTDSDRDDTLLSSSNAARHYVAESVSAPSPSRLTLRLIGDTDYNSTIERMLARSATFRRQYARLIRASHLSIVIKYVLPAGRREPAMTRLVRRPRGMIEATVHVAPSTRLVELLAHEFEHIIEHLDGIDLHARGRLPASGVWRTVDANTFETSRAIAMGQRVALEVDAGTP